jgi:hypothetical protein
VSGEWGRVNVAEGRDVWEGMGGTSCALDPICARCF